MSAGTAPDHPESHCLIPKEAFEGAFRKSMFASAVVSGALAINPAFAQNSATTLEPVTVQGQADGYKTPDTISSPKFTAPLLDTPRSITVISEQLIEDRGATSLQDVLRTTPGVTLGSGEGGTPVGDRPFIRGYEASTDIFVDGLRDYSRGSHETFNLESIEIIKGPSSAYTGRGGTGGSINLQTKTPKLDNFFEVSAGYGNADQWRATTDGNIAFSDTGAFRLNMMKMGGDMPGRDGVTIDRWGIAPSIAFGLGTPTRVTLSYSHIENNDMPDLGVPFRNDANPDRTTPPNVDRDNFYGRHNTDFRENVFDMATAQLEHDLSSNVTVRNTTRYGTTLNHYLMTRPSFANCEAGDGAPCATEGPDVQFTRQDRARWRSSETLINQTDLYGSFTTGSLTHNFSTGVEFSKEDIYSKDMKGLPGSDLDSLYNPNPNRNYNYNITRGPKENAGNIKTTSIYALDTIDLNEQFSVNLGLRYDSFRVDSTEESRRDNFLNYQLGLVYKPAPNGSIYLSYATSSNPSGENLGQAGGADGAASGAAVRDLEPEKSRSWELGTKWDFLNDRLSFTAALFETKKTDARTTDPLTGDITLAGNNRVRGIELGLTGSITPKWDIWAGYTYLDPKTLEYQNGSNNYDGNQMKFIAKQSATLWTTYKVHPKFTVGGGVSYLGERYVDDANTLTLPSHVRYDAMARYDINKQFALQLNVNNISDTELYDASHVGIFANVGAGRSYMLTATYRYE
ncbi:TonB-dependent receptor [Pollutimonas harenae]|uniref:TonB-dependent siderophore receptor n=1 Tax=Pollutimonas harenae TaxID=657015 RepID=A0A853GUW0_9BURK|nr:TonB-dependent siderophore receptor [Pollutimonas harenae]NYT86968.1 TonB-dependent siderophore receptor [Pollutimonas harenae]TEA69269.1 TonB-dependent siderophore receptor [Pollutimonas harenae]